MERTIIKPGGWFDIFVSVSNKGPVTRIWRYSQNIGRIKWFRKYKKQDIGKYKKKYLFFKIYPIVNEYIGNKTNKCEMIIEANYVNYCYQIPV